MPNENSASETCPKCGCTPCFCKPRFEFKLISPTRVRAEALKYAQAKRPFCQFQRVSENFLIAVEAAALATMKSRIDSHPSKGKTLM
jgi:hypothetical protein